MQYDDIFPKPITEYTDEEIIARAIQLREVAKTTKIIKAEANKTKKAKTKKDKMAEEMEKLAQMAEQVQEDKKGNK